MEYNKDKIIIEIDNLDKYDEISSIISKHCKLCVEESIELDVPEKENNDYMVESGIYKFDDGNTLKNLINDLDKLCKYVTFIDMDSKEELLYIGKLTISFDKIKYIKKDTFKKKIDKLRVFKTELGYCKGYKPNLRLMETTYAVNMGYLEVIYLVSNSLDNLMKLDSLIEDKLLEFDSNFELDFELVNLYIK